MKEIYICLVLSAVCITRLFAPACALHRPVLVDPDYPPFAETVADAGRDG